MIGVLGELVVALAEGACVRSLGRLGREAAGDLWASVVYAAAVRATAEPRYSPWTYGAAAAFSLSAALRVLPAIVGLLGRRGGAP